MIKCIHCNFENTATLSCYKYHDILECQDCKNWTKNKIETCCRNPDEIYVFEYDEHKPRFIRLQCNNCGGCLTMTKPFPFAEYSNKVEGEFSKLRFQEWKQARQTEGKQIGEIAQYIKFTNTTFYKYNIYLQSYEWKILREEVLNRDNHRCQYCNQAKATEIHHLTYEHLGNELLNELISYCSACHLKVHRITRKDLKYKNINKNN